MRVPIRVLYFGQVYVDRDVPWHYPWFYFAVDGAGRPARCSASWGLVRGLADRRADPFPLLLAGSIALFLVVFSTRVPVYDGERLFLLVFPLWAILIGRGFAVGLALGERHGLAPCVLGSWRLLAQGYGVVTTPPVRPELLQRPGRRPPGGRTARAGTDLLGRRGRPCPARPPGRARPRRTGPPRSLPTLYPGQGTAAPRPAP